MKHFDPYDYLLFEGIVGSRLYGTSTPESDLDIRGVFVPPIKVLIDPFQKTEIFDSFEGEDKSLYSLSKLFQLCADNNPNVLEILFIPEQFTNFSHPLWEKIVNNKHLFLSKNVKHKFLGYAISQLEAIKRHREWFIDPPSHKPTREEFGLNETPSVSMAWINAIKTTMNFDIIKPDMVDEIRKEESYRKAKKKWDNYMQWQTNRNPKRKASEEKIGFDGKYASHLFRLMSEGKDLLLHGEITFPLVDAEWLLSIKNGKYSYEEILDMSDELKEKFEEWYDISPLHHKPDRNSLKELYYEIVEEYSETR